MAIWHFWIDVGGTFTDSFGRRPDGALTRHKGLSSGVTKGSAAAGSSREAIVDSARRSNPPHFWRGFRLQLLDANGQTCGESTVDHFDATTGTLNLATPLAESPQPGQAYELTCGLEAPLIAIRYMLGLPLDQAIPPVSVRLGTTRGTNALITRRGAKTALVTTQGFGDVLKIGYQNRPRLFDLNIRKPEPLAADVLEMHERLASDGTVLIAPNVEEIRRGLAELQSKGIESLAIVLLHGFAYPQHEELVAKVAREVGFTEISLSSQVAPLEKIVPRGDTTVMDAYLNPILRKYVSSLQAALVGSDLRILTSAGGLVPADRFVGKDSILSGPAGGVVGFSRVAQAAGFERAIGFDMGGTSTDVSRFDGRFELEYETEKSGVRVVAPMMSIETVAAGGGSVCWFDGVKLVVGPQSAGASPGPACYGRGGPLTVTDVNFFLGKIPPARFPFPLDRAVVEQRLSAMADEIASRTGKRYDLAELAEGYVRVANANMVKAIRSISVARGADPRDYVLVSFGGAAAQHACQVAAELGMRAVLNHPDAGLLSAYGIGLADIERHRMAGVYQPYSDESLSAASSLMDQLADKATAEVIAEGIPASQVSVSRAIDLRYQGVDASLTIPEATGETYAQAFAREHQRRYGYTSPNRALEVMAVHVTASGRSAEPLPKSVRVVRVNSASSAVGDEKRQVYFGGKFWPTPVLERSRLEPGQIITGPAIVCEAASTTVIDPGWQAEVLSQGELVLSPVSADSSRGETSRTRIDATGPADPVALEIFNHQFAGIAEQMGITLRNTSCSVNVKQRLDFSCAIFTPEGDLVVNAPHIPVHLGAMSETVRRIVADNPHMQPGDVLVSNDPYRGGSHLPDITVVTPVHGQTAVDGTPALLFFTASRAHHAEVGGIAPGSMPPFSRTLAEEGILIRNFKLIAAGESRFDELRELLLSGAYPTRDVAANLADIAAQVAANQQGARDLLALVERQSLAVVQAYMRHIQAAAEQKARAALSRLPDGVHRFVDHLDNGSPIAVTITIAGDQATIDFTGTGPVMEGNLNANRAITMAAVMYVLRLLIDEDIPLNQGVIAPVSIVLPECLLNPPEHARPEDCAAVVGGNVETSQRVVDMLLGALGQAAASQGTMNNLTFGNERFGYYETICGGAGATAMAAGCDAVHTHMTNTRLTDPETVERRFPVRVLEFSIRRGSGGQGQHRGGDGITRRLEFLEPLKVSILAERRGPYPPYGMHGGQPGSLGRQWIEQADGTRRDLPGKVQLDALPGDVLVIETPGGGGWGQ